jgi:hypothetical protein
LRQVDIIHLLCIAWFGQVFGRRAALHHWQAACQKAMYDKTSYQTCRTNRTCRNAERPHTETTTKQPRPRRAGEIKIRRAAPAGSGRPRWSIRGLEPEEDPPQRVGWAGIKIKTRAASAGSFRTRRSTRGRSPSTQTHRSIWYMS